MNSRSVGIATTNINGELVLAIILRDETLRFRLFTEHPLFMDQVYLV
jgi:hypothetical protein